MRRLFWLIVVVAAVYSAYWFVGRAGLTRGLDAAEAKLPGLTYESRNTMGFPSRFDTTYQGVNLLLPDGTRYTTPTAQAFALSYAPTKAIAFAPGPHVLTEPDGTKAALTTEDLRGSVKVGASLNPPIQEAIAELTSGRLSLNDRAIATLGSALMAVQDEGENRYKVHIKAADLRPLGNFSDLPPIDSFTVDAIVETHAPVIVGPMPPIRSIQITGSELLSAGAVQSIKGTLQVDTLGRLNGPVELDLQVPDQMIDAAAQAGLIPTDAAQQLKQALVLASGGSNTVQLDTEAKDGVLMFGPFPLMELPRLVFTR